MAIDFPTPSQVGQVYTDPTSGNTYICVVLGPPAEWTGSSDNADLDLTYLRVDASNGPVSGNLGIGGTAAAPNIILGTGGTIAGPNTSVANKYSIDATGKVSIGGSPSAPNIALNADGTSEFNEKMLINQPVPSSGILDIASEGVIKYSFYPDSPAATDLTEGLSIGTNLTNLPNDAKSFIGVDGRAFFKNSIKTHNPNFVKVNPVDEQYIELSGGLADTTSALKVESVNPTGSVRTFQIDWDGTTRIGGIIPATPNITMSPDGKVTINRETVGGQILDLGNNGTVNYIFAPHTSAASNTAGLSIGTNLSNIPSDTNTFLGCNGNASFSGSVSKGSGSFKIDHPLPAKKDTHHLVHSFIEGPQADNIYRGEVTLVNGTATVDLDVAARMTPGTFVLLNTNVSCFTSNETDWTPVRGSVSGSTLTIEAKTATSTATVHWLVIGERHDQHMLDTGWTDENGRVITEPTKGA